MLSPARLWQNYHSRREQLARLPQFTQLLFALEATRLSIPPDHAEVISPIDRKLVTLILDRPQHPYLSNLEPPSLDTLTEKNANYLFALAHGVEWHPNLKKTSSILLPYNRLAAATILYNHPSQPTYFTSLLEATAYDAAMSRTTSTRKANTLMRLLYLSVVGPSPEVVAATFDQRWRTPDAVNLAREALLSHDPGVLSILADAIQEAGCTLNIQLETLRDDHLVFPSWTLIPLIQPTPP